MSQQSKNIVNSSNCSVGEVTANENRLKRRDLDDRDTGDIENNAATTVPSTTPTKVTKQEEIIETAIKTLRNGIDKTSQISFLGGVVVGIFQPDWPEFLVSVFDYEF
ncbi:hypothetical protein HA402_013205 [Bradysia odoriphaga]|nr:hypothetical protein HA402_013205 [Bradysia odoriphaga]